MSSSVNRFNYEIVLSTKYFLDQYLKRGDFQGGYAFIQQNEHMYGQLFTESGLRAWYADRVNHSTIDPSLNTTIAQLRSTAFTHLPSKKLNHTGWK